MIQQELKATMVVGATIGFADIVIGEGTPLIFIVISVVELSCLSS